MRTYYPSELRTSITSEANVLATNFSNAINTFRGTSILVSDRMENKMFKNFLKLKDSWVLETMFASNSNEIFNNHAYQEIICMGQKSVPWIIRELKKSNDHWFFALREITGVDPILPEHYGKINDMKNDWINWYEQNNY
ncbi:hypothetical protein ABH942_001634 [Flavobacterium sp. 28YEA47A]|uniref:hypothetical protein n=1 Tax=Flavobacterium sp. 28YEA47A TaxID=3156276 RepID=UPI003515576C